MFSVVSVWSVSFKEVFLDCSGEFCDFSKDDYFKRRLDGGYSSPFKSVDWYLDSEFIFYCNFYLVT